MNTPLAIENAVIVAAVTPPRSKAAFNRGRVIVRGPDGKHVDVRTYTSTGAVEGPSLSKTDVEDLVAGKHAIAWDETTLVAGAALWVLRRNLPGRDRCLHQLQSKQCLLTTPRVGADDALLCMVDERSPTVATLRDQWHKEALTRAWHNTSQGELRQAELDAKAAFALSRGLDVKTLAVLSLAYEGNGREVRARGVIAMAENSRGSEFASLLERERTRLQQSRCALHIATTVVSTNSLREALLATSSRKFVDLGPRTARLVPTPVLGVA
ncbi:MAG: hypothetical protein JKY37_05825 [Nannocystaceae bacterium]|nr:hypothetical protein [Nannocystaceae bacterium]